MLTFLLISESQTVLNCLKALLELIVPDLQRETLLSISLTRDADASNQKRLAEFDRVYNEINAEIQKNDLVHNRFIGIIDCPFARKAEELHALTKISGMLILAFPEIQWLPLYKDANIMDGNMAASTMNLTRAIDLCRGDYSPLFDGDGLRGILLDRVRNGSDSQEISPRVDLAFAVDEESHYAFMNAYTAFRFGYRSVPVVSKRCADMLLQDIDKFPHAYRISWKDQKAEMNHGQVQDTLIQSTVVFEDLFLKFPDCSDAESNEIDFGDKRDDIWNVLKQATLRVITTSSSNEEKVANNKTMTLERYFAQDSTRKQVAVWKKRKRDGNRKKWIEKVIYRFFRNNWERKIHNYLGGYWISWWGLNLLNWIVFLGLLLTALCCHEVIPVVILGCVFPYMIWRNANRDKISKEIGRGSGRKLTLRIKRWQWIFMPKLYESHNPLWLDDIPKQGEDTFWEVAHKPTAGIFGLRNKCCLPNACKFTGIYNSEKIRQIYDIAIRKSVFTLPEEEKNVNGHGSPGMAQEIAMWLIRRAERMKDNIIDVEGAVHAAVLSDVACELLDCKTPTMAIEALKWKHYFEVLAECEFVGVTDEVDVKDRYIDIHNALGRICRAENGIVREKVFNSGMAEIMDTLAVLLRSKGKMEEAAYFTKYSRHYHRRLMQPFMRSLLAYPEWVLFKTLNFGISFGLLFLFFAVYCFFHVTGHQIWLSLTTTCKVLFTQINDIKEISTDANFDVVSSIARQMAYLHLGFIAAHFLLFVNRR